MCSLTQAMRDAPWSPTPTIGAVYRRRRSLRMSSATAAVGAFVLAGASFASVGDTPQPLVLRGHGISIRLPVGWTGVIYKRTRGLPILHAASLKLPRADGDDGAINAVPRMHRDDVLLVMLQGDPKFAGYPRRRLPIQLRSSDFAAPVEGMPLSHAFARVDFTYRERAFDLWVEFATKPARRTVISKANRVLESMHLLTAP